MVFVYQRPFQREICRGRERLPSWLGSELLLLETCGCWRKGHTSCLWTDRPGGWMQSPVRLHVGLASYPLSPCMGSPESSHGAGGAVMGGSPDFGVILCKLPSALGLGFSDHPRMRLGHMT